MMISKEEFDKLIKDYPNKLTIDISHISTPPTICYYDFTEDEGWDALRFCKREVWNSDYTPTGSWTYSVAEKPEKITHNEDISQRKVMTYKPEDVRVYWNGVEIGGFTEDVKITNIKGETK